MKTKIELEEGIMILTNKINSEFPELSKYIAEIPVIETESSGVNNKNLEEYYESLKGIIKKYATTHDESNISDEKENDSPSGYPSYPAKEDIYEKSQEQKDLNPEDLSKKKSPNEESGSWNEKAFVDDKSGGDLDVPGSELDDQQESVGSEDEENNYYSLGGDNHNDLDEDKG